MNRVQARRLLVLALVAIAAPMQALQAQEGETGRVIGRVLDAESAKPLSTVQVYIDDGSIGTLSDLNGRFVIDRVPSGRVSVTAQIIGYGTKTITDLDVEPGQAVNVDITLETSAVELDAVVVTAERERSSQVFLLDERRTSTAMVEAVGAVEISRRPDSDAADVAQRMTGVTVTDGKYVFVRGLGERYSQTTLNGSSLPSPEPEREVVPLDLFPSGFLESLETQKSYTADLPADFSGGSVKIETKDFPNRLTVRLGVSSSFNTSSQFHDGFLNYVGGKRDFLGFDDGTRDQPDVVTQLMGDPSSGQRLPADANQRIAIGQAFQQLGQGFTPRSGDTPLNRSFNLSIGARSDIFDEGEVGYFLAGSYSDSYALRENEIERKWRVSAFNPDTPENLRQPNVDYAFTRGTRNVGWGTVGNLTFKPNRDQKISLRTTINVSTEDEARRYEGPNREDIGATVRSDRLRFVSRVMFWSQLSGEHALFGTRLTWRAAGARATRNEPLLREAVYIEDDGVFTLLPIGESGRYLWSDLTDDDLSGAVDWEIPVDMLVDGATVKVGGAYRNRSRDFAARRLNWRFLGNTVQDLDQALSTATIVDQVRNPGEFAIDEVVEPGDLYGATDERMGGYGQLTVPFGNLEAIAGLRVESYSLGLDSRGSTLQDVSQVDLAPSLNLIFKPRADVRFRGAISQTVDRPEFRELAPFQFTEATSLRQLYGNPELIPATILNTDLRADWFPQPGEIISIGGFYKRLENPIEQVFLAAASDAYSFQNAERAEIRGIELDVQLSLARLANMLDGLSMQTNYSWINSQVTVRQGTGGFEPTNLDRPLEGQASYVLNAGLNYATFSGLEAGVFFNRFGKRLTAAGGSGIPDLYEKPRNSLDASFGFPIPTASGARVKISGSNLLDSEYRFEQSANGITQVQQLYTVGRTFSVGLSWEF
ncbi:MAG: TonB-dependent receptor [Gemmatimonadota bacterium]|jgi:hypothetical protein